MKKYKIAFVANASMIGGVEEALIQILRNIDYSQYSVTLFGDVIDLYRSRIPPQVEIVSMCSSFKNDLVSLFKSQQFFKCLCYLFNHICCKVFYSLKKKDIQAYLSMRSYRYLPNIADEQYDLVVAYTFLVSSIVGHAAYCIDAKKRVLWVHGESARSLVSQKLDKFVYNLFDTVFCCSQSVADKFNQLYPISGRKTEVFYNIADVKRIIFCSEKPLPVPCKHPAIVTVGRLSEEKGQHLIPKTVRLLLDAGYNFHWYIVGDGPLRKQLEDLIQSEKVSDNISLVGAQSNPYPYFKNCDIYVQPSFTEGYCTTTIEAKILKKPIVTTDAPGMREQIVSGENGIIVDAMTSKALFEGIKMLLDYPEIREKFVKNLQNENHNQVKELEKLYYLLEKKYENISDNTGI